MDKDSLRDLVKRYIKDFAFSHLKDLKNGVIPTKKDGKDEHDYDIDEVLFYAGKKPSDEELGKIVKKDTIKEEQEKDIPKITTGEVKQFENAFKEAITQITSADVAFDSQKNGHSLIAFKQSGVIEAQASGVITFGNRGNIKWRFSILNGVYIDTDSLEIDFSNKTITEMIYNFYDSWQTEWRNKFSL